jgi:hypothetical protein
VVDMPLIDGEQLDVEDEGGAAGAKSLSGMRL